MLRRWWPVAVPAAAGIAAALVVDGSTQVYAEVTARSALAALGIAASLAVAGAAGARVWVRRARRRAFDEGATTTQDDRRRFLLRLDHELKNPLTAIRAGVANIEAASEAEPGDAVDGRALESVRAQAVRLGSLLADLRKLAELETRPIEQAEVDVAAILREVESAIAESPEAEGRVVSLTLPQAPWPLPAVSGDRDLVFLALHNLATNAVKYSRVADLIEIRASEESDHVVIEVADTGMGIPEDEVGHVWEELSRGRAARGLSGTGLGLALVRTIVSRHGGSTALRSRAGQGTVVTVRLPIARRP